MVKRQMNGKVKQCFLRGLCVTCFAGMMGILFARAEGTDVTAAEELPAPILYYDFEEEDTSGRTVTDRAQENTGKLHDRAMIRYNRERDSKVLSLSGGNGYLEFPQGFFDGRDTLTISMDVCSSMGNENFFTLAIGKDTDRYLFLRTRGGEFRYAITKGSWGAEQDVAGSGSFQKKWINVTLVLTPRRMQLYLNGEMVEEQSGLTTKISDFGSNVLGYLGKSFYSGDAYFKGEIDNVMVYEEALTAMEISRINGVTLAPFRGVESKNDIASVITWKADKENRQLTVYVSKSNTKNKMAAELTFLLQENAKKMGEEVVCIPFGESREVNFSVLNEEEEVQTWTVTAVSCNNPVIPGQYADPDIDVFGDKYYLYMTTDGFSGWSGTKFHVFSSDNLVDWTDEGVILDVAGDDVAWSVGSAWAPSIEEKNGKYYFYFCAKKPEGDSCIGVAVAEHPTGPFVAMPEPLLTIDMCREQRIAMGQTIDPSVFTEEDGTSYLLFGNGAAAIVPLNEDMVSVNLSEMKNYQGAKDFREAITVTKKNGIYHFTWSCDDTGSENYHINYGTSDQLYGPITYRYTILEKREEDDILGTGHHCMLQIPGTEEYYIAYHRFFTPLGKFTDGKGFHRETCIDAVFFDENSGWMLPVTPTLEGIAPRPLQKMEEDLQTEKELSLEEEKESGIASNEKPEAELPPEGNKQRSRLLVGIGLAAATAAVAGCVIRKKRKNKKTK